MGQKILLTNNQNKEKKIVQEGLYQHDDVTPICMY